MMPLWISVTATRNQKASATKEASPVIRPERVATYNGARNRTVNIARQTQTGHSGESLGNAPTPLVSYTVAP